MSVYYEALKSGRISLDDCSPTFRYDSHGGVVVLNRGIARALREAKRYEAAERNAKTPYERTKRYRRETSKGSHR